MAYCTIRAARMTAMLLALRATDGQPDPEGTTRAVLAVRDNFDEADPLRIEVERFAHGFTLARRNPELLIDAGKSLLRAVERSCWPASAGRADIEG